MSLEALYVAHVGRVIADTEAALERSKAAGTAFDGVVFHAGGELLVHRDDQTHVFRPDYHFARWVPLAGPDHLISLEPGRKPRLVRVVPKDYWYESPPPPPVDITRVFEVSRSRTWTMPSMRSGPGPATPSSGPTARSPKRWVSSPGRRSPRP